MFGAADGVQNFGGFCVRGGGDPEAEATADEGVDESVYVFADEDYAGAF